MATVSTKSFKVKARLDIDVHASSQKIALNKIMSALDGKLRTKSIYDYKGVLNTKRYKHCVLSLEQSRKLNEQLEAEKNKKNKKVKKK